MNATAEEPIVGWVAIASAISRITKSSVCDRTARRYAQHGKANRLPVFKFIDNGNVYILPSHLTQWAQNRSIPVGARMVGASQRVVRRVRPCP